MVVSMYRKRPTTCQTKIADLRIGDKVELTSGVVAVITAIEDRHGYRILIALGRRWRFPQYGVITSHFCAGLN